MAKLNRIVRAEPLSRFQQVGPSAGAGFGLLAEAMETLYSRLAPAAQEEMAAKGKELGIAEGTASAGELQIDYPDPVIQGKVNFDATLRNQAMAAHGGPTNAAAAELGFDRHEAERGLPSGYLGRTARLESSLDPNAQNDNSSAGGLFQFIDSTAQQYGLTDRFDPVASTEAAARLAADNKASLTKALGRDPTGAELYLAHQQGAGGAAALLTAGPRLAAAVVGEEAVRLNGGDPATMSASDFAKLWTDKYDKTPDVSTQGGASRSGTLRFKNKGQENLSPTFRGVLESVAGKYGGLDITSGSRDAGHNAKVGGAKGSRHIKGEAADIDMSGMSETERESLVRDLYAAGAKGFITYTNTPNMLHVDMGVPGVRPNAHFMHDKTSQKIQNAPAWFQGVAGELQGSAGNAPVVSTQGAAPAQGQTYTQPAPTVTFRNGEGKLEGKLYSPFSGPILQAHNVAAKSAYQATVLAKGQTDLMQISQAFKLDPQGFEREAAAYIDQLVGSADAEFKSTIRAELTDEMTRRGIGILDAQQSDVRQRAGNSNKALVDRYSADYADSLAAGDAATAEVLRAKLTDVLRMRETLPGLSWTMDQSANVILDAQRAAQTERSRRRTAYQKQTKDQFSLITKAAKAGRRADGEEILNDPAAIEANPEAAREARAFTTLRDQMPEFLRMTPAEMLAAVDRMSEVEVSEEWQLDVVDAARKMAVENRKAWDEDPVLRAGEVLETPPPDIAAAIATGDPARIATVMGERRDYMNGILDSGYTETRAYLSEDEAANMATLLNAGADPALRATMAGAIVEGFGDDAVRVFEEIDGDKLTMYAGKLMASGGRPALAEEILRGQTIMSEGIVEVPTDKTVRETFNTDFQPAFMRVPGGLEAQSDVMQVARAIYSARVAGLTLDEEQKADLLRESLNAAMGGRKDKRNRPTGGVQPIRGVPTLLPVGLAGEDVEMALNKALPGSLYGDGGEGILNNLQNALMNTTASALDMQPEPRLDAFDAASMTGVPLFNGKPLDREVMMGADFGLISVGGDNYMLSITVGDQTYHAENQYGKNFVFGLTQFVEASR